MKNIRVRIYTGTSKEENYVMRSFFSGCDCDDVWIGDLDHYEPSDVAVVFGTYKKHVPVSYRRGHVVHEQKKHGLDTVILETGYIDRGAGPHHYYAVGLNGLNGRADFKNKNSPADRAVKFLDKLQPWREDGDHILLCGQVPWDASVQHIDFVKWTEDTADILQSLTGRPIVYRPHPLAKTHAPIGTKESQNYWIEDDLKNCWCVVTFNSNSGVDAIMSGIPAVAMDEGSMLKGVETNIGSVNNPFMPDRTQWLNDLSYAQWTPDEMAKGKAWDHLFR